MDWPWGAEYDKPQPVRVCYPNVALKNRTLHFCGVSDIVEPCEKWLAFKREMTGLEWDFDFRRLFYTWSPDISTGRFAEWVEVSSRDATAGWITPGDMWVAPDGAVHVVWCEKAIDERLRERFFPGAVQSYAVKYAVIQEGEVTRRRTLMESVEGTSAETPAQPRFQATPQDRLFACYYVNGTDAAGQDVSENRVLELCPDGTVGPTVVLPLEHPIRSFFTATTRAGSPPSDELDMLGIPPDDNCVRHARVRLCE